MFGDTLGHIQDFKNDTRLDGRPTYDLHWKPINYKTRDGILYAHDFDEQWGAISNEFRRDLFSNRNW